MGLYSIDLTGFECIEAESPLEAARILAGWIKEDAFSFIYDVTDEETSEKFGVDLSDDSVYKIN